MLTLDLITLDTERRAREFGREAGGAAVAGAMRRGVLRRATAAQRGIRQFTPVREGLTRDSLLVRVQGAGTEVRAALVAVAVPRRPPFLFQLLNDGSRAHKIAAGVRANGRQGYLRFIGTRGVVFTREVRHPGTKAYRQVERGMAASRQQQLRASRDTLREVTRLVTATR
jgi:hypothetical protein